MKIIHSTYGIERALSILQEGIRPPTNIGERFNTPFRFSDKVFLVVLSDFCKGGVWGNYHFVIGEDYFSTFSHQFRVHADKDSDKEFYEFVKRFGIKSYEGNHCLSTHNQIISLSSINPAGLEKLITPKELTPQEKQAIQEVMPAHMELQISKL